MLEDVANLLARRLGLVEVDLVVGEEPEGDVGFDVAVGEEPRS